ncbi:hypothetical protein A7A09_014130 [Paracoccus methylarcula]|uniref:Uncharacterized protein n=1 Tax=Paracoccus methylarcula TaxID=72022 RepID=A0A3R7NBB8_9RHOB|nr:hypothetical protein A7A09_014130 [Paracoccus methylarcula]
MSTLFYKKLTNLAEQIFIAVPYPVFVNCAVSFAKLCPSLLTIRPTLSTIVKKGIKYVARIPECMAKLLLRATVRKHIKEQVVRTIPTVDAQ